MFDYKIYGMGRWITSRTTVGIWLTNGMRNFTVMGTQYNII